MWAAMTIAGLTQYKSDLWDGLVLPQPPTAESLGVQETQIRAAWTINKDLLINHICMTCYSMGLTFPDGDFMKNAIAMWSSTNAVPWQRYFDTLFYRYNPIWNKDGTITESGRTSDNVIGSSTGSVNDIGNGSATGSTHPYNGTINQSETPDWVHADKTETTNSNSRATSENHSESKAGTNNVTRVEQGNIGVTTTQHMILEERDIAMANIYDMIAESFKKTFCIMLY